MPYNRKFRKVEVREVGGRMIDLDVRVQHGLPSWYILGGYTDPSIDHLGVTISIIVNGKHGVTKFEDWIFDSEDLQYAGQVDIERFIELGDCHDIEIFNPQARVKIRIRRSYTGFISWDVIERRVVRRGLLWEPKLAVA